MDIEDIIKEFDIYSGKNNIFKVYKKNVKKFVDTNDLKEVLTFDKERLYLKGKKKKEDKNFFRDIGSETLMGTVVGQAYNHLGKFIDQDDKIEKFRGFIKDLLEIDEKGIYEALGDLITRKNYSKDLSTIKTFLIQILACYFPNKFLPIYKKEELFRFIENFGIERQDLKEKYLWEGILISNELLLKKKNSHEVMKHWDNIKFTHFLFMCFPIEAIIALDKLKMGFKFLGTKEPFVVGLFSRFFDKLGFKSITRLKESFPDAEAEDENVIIRNIEFESQSSSFIEHGHDPKLCDIIVCWHDDLDRDWKEKYPNIRIIKFEDIMVSDSELYQKLMAR